MAGRTLAVIDLGTHSALLLIARCRKQDDPEIVEQAVRITRLGAELNESGRISAESLRTTIAVLQEFTDRARRCKVSGIFLIGTEVFRVARNSPQAIGEIERQTGLKLQVLTPQEEAHFAYRGAVGQVAEDQIARLVIDIGGGSTELILGRGGKIEHSHSLPIGAVKLAQKMNGQVTLCSSDRLGLMQYVKLLLQEVPFRDALSRPQETVVTGGTVTTLAAVKLGMTNYDWDRINRTSLTRAEIWDLFFRLNKLDLAGRRQVPGMEARREDVILYGTIILLTLLELARIDAVRVSDRGLRYGYLAARCRDL